MTLQERLEAILRRAERGRSYGKLMWTSKDICLDDVISHARAALAEMGAPQTPAPERGPDWRPTVAETMACLIAHPGGEGEETPSLDL
jgi:hypothetical protein